MEMVRREQVRLKIPNLHFPHQESKEVCFTHFCTMVLLVAEHTKMPVLPVCRGFTCPVVSVILFNLLKGFTKAPP